MWSFPFVQYQNETRDGFMKSFFLRWEILLPSIYIAGALVVWFDFTGLPPDGLANVGIALYTLPNFFIIRFLSRTEFPFFDGGYYQAHALYFSINVVVNAILHYYIVRGVRRFRQRGSLNAPTQ